MLDYDKILARAEELYAWHKLGPALDSMPRRLALPSGQPPAILRALIEALNDALVREPCPADVGIRHDATGKGIAKAPGTQTLGLRY